MKPRVAKRYTYNRNRCRRSGAIEEDWKQGTFGSGEGTIAVPTPHLLLDPRLSDCAACSTVWAMNCLVRPSTGNSIWIHRPRKRFPRTIEHSSRGSRAGPEGQDPIARPRRACTGVLCAASAAHIWGDRKSTRLNSSHSGESRMPSSA